MIDTSGSEKTCSPILFHFVSWSGLASGCQITTQQGQACRVLFSLFALYLTLQVLFSVFTSQIDSCNEKWEKIRQVRAEAGRKGGAKKGNQNAAKQKQAKQANVCFAKQKQANISKTSCNCY